MSQSDVVIGMTSINYEQLIWLAAFALISLAFAKQARQTNSILATLAAIIFGLCAIHRSLVFIIPALMACQPSTVGCALPEPYETVLRLSRMWHAPLFFSGALAALLFTRRKS